MIFHTCWVQGESPRVWHCQHINAQEFFPVYLALHLIGALWSGHVIVFVLDKLAVVQIINKNSTQDPLLLFMLHAITLLTLRFDCCICVRHIPGSINYVADKLYRRKSPV